MMHFSVPPVGGQPLQDLQFEGQGHENGSFSHRRQRPIVPALASPQPVSLNVESHAGNEYHQTFLILLRHRPCSGRLQNAVTAGLELISRFHPDQGGLSPVSQLRVEELLARSQSVVTDFLRGDLVPDRAIKRDRPAPKIGGKMKDLLLDPVAPEPAFSRREGLPAPQGRGPKCPLFLSHKPPHRWASRWWGERRGEIGMGRRLLKPD